MLEPCMTVIECGLHRYEVVFTSVCLGRRVGFGFRVWGLGILEAGDPSSLYAARFHARAQICRWVCACESSQGASLR
jgi:hypothetical protein